MQGKPKLSDLNTRIDNVRAKVASVVAKAEQMYGVDLSSLLVNFDLRGGVAGWAYCRHCFGGKPMIKVRFNVDMIGNNGYDHIVNDTVPHEIAHIVCGLKPFLGKNHNPGWKRVCIELGGCGCV